MSAPLRLYLLRHAAHGDVGLRLTGRADGGPLTPEGEAQAAALARRLAGAGIAEVLTSPRLRTRLTAEAVARGAGAPLRVEPALDEIDFGAWTGAAFADLDGDPAWDRWNRARATACPPGGEPMSEAAGRVSRLARALAQERPGEAVALVSHADVIRGLVATALGMPLDNLLRLEVAPASVTRIDASPWGMTLAGLNDTGATA
jgi:broad specificity phosphatase PhoE